MARWKLTLRSWKGHYLSHEDNCVQCNDGHDKKVKGPWVHQLPYTILHALLIPWHISVHWLGIHHKINTLFLQKKTDVNIMLRVANMASESSAYLLEIAATQSKLIGCLLLSQEICKLICWYWRWTWNEKATLQINMPYTFVLYTILFSIDNLG